MKPPNTMAMLAVRSFIATVITVAFFNSAVMAGTTNGWQFSWSEEFNGTEVDTNLWGYELGYVRNNEAQYYTSRTNNAYIENGKLVIQALRDNWNTGTNTNNLTSASLNTKGKKSWLYGRFEMRAKIDTRSGSWPAWWWLGTNDATAGWPKCGEIDMMEYYQYKCLLNVMNGNQSWKSITTPVTDTFTNGFHIWTMDWNSNQITLYLDGVSLNQYNLTNADGTGPGGINPFRQPGYMLINQAIGGLNGGVWINTAFPITYSIDWIRVHTWTNGASYNLTVNGGVGGSSYLAGTTASITGIPVSGMQFCGWVVNSGNPVIDNLTSESAVLTMPTTDVTVSAVYIPSTANAVITNNSAVNITSNSATLSAIVESMPSAGYDIWAYWGLVDGATNGGGLWAYTNYLGWFTNAGVFTVTNPPTSSLSNLMSNTKYYYTFSMSNAVGMLWASPSASFTTAKSAYLVSLVPNTGTLNPSFASNIFSYTASVPNTTNSLTLRPTAADANATITVNGNPVASGNSSGAISLNVGANVIAIVVTAQDGLTTNTYSITVTRLPVNDYVWDGTSNIWTSLHWTNVTTSTYPVAGPTNSTDAATIYSGSVTQNVMFTSPLGGFTLAGGTYNAYNFNGVNTYSSYSNLVMTGGSMSGSGNYQNYGAGILVSTMVSGSSPSTISASTFYNLKGIGASSSVFNVAANANLSVTAQLADVSGGTSWTTAALVKTGGGTLMLSGSNTFTGGVLINGGTLRVATGSGTRCASSTTIANSAGCIFGVQLAAANGQWISSSNLIVSGANSEIDIDYKSTTPSTSTSQDPIKVATLTVSGVGTLKILGDAHNFSAGSTYPLINFTASGPAAANPYMGLALSLPTGLTGHLATMANHLELVVDSNTAKFWNSVSTNWDSATPWANTAGDSASFNNGDGVYFGDAAGVSGNPTITVSGASVSPLGMTMNSTNHNYTISGNPIAGTGLLNISASPSRILTLNGANSFSGGTILASGQLNINNGGSGSTNSAIGTGALTINGGVIDNTSSGDVTLLPNIIQNWNGSFTYIGSAHNLNLGNEAVAMNTSLQITVSANTLTVGGDISGASNSLTKLGAGTLTLSGANTYSGATIVSNGVLLVNGSLANLSTVSVFGGTLGGTGTVNGTVSVNAGGTISAGVGLGTLNSGSQTWNGGATNQFELNSATNSAGWDLLNITGTLNMQATAGNPFTVKLVSLTATNTLGLLPDFNPNTSYTWAIASASGGIQNFTTDRFVVDASAFSNSYSGTFVVTNLGNILAVSYVPPTLLILNIVGSYSNASFPMTFSGPNGQTYHVLCSSNLMLPLSGWTTQSSGIFGGSPVNYTDTSATNVQRFYRIQSP